MTSIDKETDQSVQAKLAKLESELTQVKKRLEDIEDSLLSPDDLAALDVAEDDIQNGQAECLTQMPLYFNS